jgi:large subunit ribosomal protein L3
MNTNPGLIGKKLGCTQLFGSDGNVTRVTVIEAGPCVVVRKRTVEKDGYSALQLAFGEKRAALVTKPLRGYFEKNGVAVRKVHVKKDKKDKDVEVLPRHLRELRLSPEEVAKFEVGQTLSVQDIFTEGQFVDVIGKTRGRGFTGVVRMWNFAGQVRTHGTHEYERHGGSIGTNMTPGRTLPGLKMPGQWGDERSTMQNLKVARVIPEQNLVCISGAVPGAKNGLVIVRGAVKRGKHA